MSNLLVKIFKSVFEYVFSNPDVPSNSSGAGNRPGSRLNPSDVANKLNWLRQKMTQVADTKVMGTVKVRFDEKTCKICKPKHGKGYTFPGVFSKEDARMEIQRIMQIIIEGGSPRVQILPKYHINCRCTMKLRLMKINVE